MAEPILELREVTKYYGSHVAVAGIDLALRQGEFLTFLGPSGSGKTTTLMMITGLQDLSSGTILLNGNPIEQLPPYRRNIGVVFQNYALFPHMTVGRNVAFPLEMRGAPRAEIDRRVEETLRIVNLPDLMHRYPRELSGGQQQRVALARAMVFGPSLLAMDEPLGALDKRLRERMQLEILRLHQERRMPILYVTHDQEEAMMMSDRIAVFNGGRIEQIGDPQALYERPATRFVAEFLGDCNFIPGIARSVDGQDCLVATPYGALAGRVRDGLQAEARVVIAVRPERVRLEPARGAVPSAGTIGGVVREIIYLGMSRKIMVQLPDGRDCVVVQQAAAAAGGTLSPGAAVWLSWSARDAATFPD